MKKTDLWQFFFKKVCLVLCVLSVLCCQTPLDKLSLSIKEPSELMSWMQQNITYLNIPDIKQWKYLSPDEVMNSKKGDCIHQSAFFKEVLGKKGRSCSLLFINREHNYDHAVCYWKDESGKFFWLENAWKSRRGMHGPFDSLEQMSQQIFDWMQEENGKVDHYTINSFDDVPYGIGWFDFLKQVKLIKRVE